MDLIKKDVLGTGVVPAVEDEKEVKKKVPLPKPVNPKTRSLTRFPSGLKNAGKTIGFRILAPEETFQLQAAHKGMRAVQELAKRAITEFDGVEVNAENKDTIYAGMEPKEHALCLQAYSRLHIPSDEQEEDFFGDMEWTVSG